MSYIIKVKSANKCSALGLVLKVYLWKKSLLIKIKYTNSILASLNQSIILVFYNQSLKNSIYKDLKLFLNRLKIKV